MSATAHRASEFLAELHQTYGKSPHLSAEIVEDWINSGISKAGIRSDYKSMAARWRANAPEAIALFRRFRHSIGQCNSVTSETVMEWIRAKWEDQRIETEYQQRRDQQVEDAKRKAPVLLNDLREAFGKCSDVQESTLQQWLADGLNDKQAKVRYQRFQEEKRQQIRAQRLRERIVQALGRLENPERPVSEINLSDKFLFNFFDAKHSDVEIIQLYLSNQYAW